MLGNVSLSNAVNFDPKAAGLDLVGAPGDLNVGNFDPASLVGGVINDPVGTGIGLITDGVPSASSIFAESLSSPSDLIGEVMKYADLTEQINIIMEIANALGSAVSYIENGIQTLTDGNIPDSLKGQTVTFIVDSISANGGTVPESLYSEVSSMLLPYVSGHTESALAMALRANDLLGIVEIAVPAGSAVSQIAKDAEAASLEPIDGFRDEYDGKLSELTTEFDALTTGDGLLKTVNAGGGGGGGGGTPSGDMSSEFGNNPPTVSLPPPPQDEQFEGVDGNWNFKDGNSNQYMTAGGRFVSSTEELECEMSAITRPISEVIVHWSETFTNANLTGLELQQLTGAGSNAYHYIIKRDGSMERGVSLDGTGSASPGHNSFSIQVCLVGGVNVASGDEDINGNLGAGSITRTQFNTLHQLFRVFFVQFPGGQALGHSEFSITENDPGFEVRDYVYNAFNKRSLYVDPMGDAEKSPDEIISSINDPEILLSEKDPDGMNENF